MYGDIGTWFVDGTNFTALISEYESAGFTEATFRMHCYGGSVFEGNVIANAWQRTRMKINVVIDGIAASMACFVLPYIPVQNVKIASNGFGMIHRPAANMSGNASEHLETAKLLLDVEGHFIKTLATRTGLKADDIKQRWFDGNDHWLNASEMVQYGLVGSIGAMMTNAETQLIASLPGVNPGQIGPQILAMMQNSNTNGFKDKEMKKELIELLGLTGPGNVPLTVESSDTAVLAAVQAKFKEKADALAALVAAEKTKTELAVTALVQKAVTEGKITDSVSATYRAIGLTAGIDALTLILSNVKERKPIMSQIIGGQPQSGQPQGQPRQETFAWYQKNDVKVLEAMPLTDPDKFKELYKTEYGVYPV